MEQFTFKHAFLEEAYSLMGEFGFPPPFDSIEQQNAIPMTVFEALPQKEAPGERASRSEKAVSNMAAAFQAYYIFRKLHTAGKQYPSGFKTLMGDYFFSLLSRLLNILDDAGLTGLDDVFSERLKNDCEADVRNNRDIDFIEYTQFVKTACRGFSV